MGAIVEQANGSPEPDNSPTHRNIIISADSGALVISEGTVELWATASFARAWFFDALGEASVANDPDGGAGR